MLYNRFIKGTEDMWNEGYDIHHQQRNSKPILRTEKQGGESGFIPRSEQLENRKGRIKLGKETWI